MEQSGLIMKYVISAYRHKDEWLLWCRKSCEWFFK